MRVFVDALGNSLPVASVTTTKFLRVVTAVTKVTHNEKLPIETALV